MLTLQLKPGVGLGPFILGKPLQVDPSSLLLSTAQMHLTPNPGFLPSRALVEASSSLARHKLIDAGWCAGQALGQAVQHIQGRKQEYRCIEVKYAEEVCLPGSGSWRYPCNSIMSTLASCATERIPRACKGMLATEAVSVCASSQLAAARQASCLTRCMHPAGSAEL